MACFEEDCWPSGEYSSASRFAWLALIRFHERRRESERHVSCRKDRVGPRAGGSCRASRLPLSRFFSLSQRTGEKKSEFAAARLARHPPSFRRSRTPRHFLESSDESRATSLDCRRVILDHYGSLSEYSRRTGKAWFLDKTRAKANSANLSTDCPTRS